jgi:putative hemolysin
MRSGLVRVGAGVCGFSLVLILGAAGVLAQVETPLPPLDGVALCELAGGTVVERSPVVHVSSKGQALGAFGQPFCEWTAADDSVISVPLNVLAASGPTLAAVAYFYPPTVVPAETVVNPSYTYCAQLQGAAMLEWIKTGDPIDVRNYCVFGDGSMIDAFGVFYKSDGTIRGADLSTVFSWRPGPEYADTFGE